MWQKRGQASMEGLLLAALIVVFLGVLIYNYTDFGRAFSRASIDAGAEAITSSIQGSLDAGEGTVTRFNTDFPLEIESVAFERGKVVLFSGVGTDEEVRHEYSTTHDLVGEVPTRGVAYFEFIPDAYNGFVCIYPPDKRDECCLFNQCAYDTRECGIGNDELWYPDTDCDGIPDWRDLDINGNGIPNLFDPDPYDPKVGFGNDSWMTQISFPEIYGDYYGSGQGLVDWLNDDIDGDGIPNWLDADPFNPNVGNHSWNESCDDEGTPCYLHPSWPINNPVAEGAQWFTGNRVTGLPWWDYDGDGIPLMFDADPTNPNIGNEDFTGDGIPDWLTWDTSGNGIPDWLDPDTDGDGVPDIVDKNPHNPRIGNEDLYNGSHWNVPNGIPDWILIDFNRDGVPDWLSIDIDGDGTPNEFDPAPRAPHIGFSSYQGQPWQTNPLVPSNVPLVPFVDLINVDGNPIPDSIPDWLQWKTCADGLPDWYSIDRDCDGVPDWFDPSPYSPIHGPIDSDGDGIPDWITDDFSNDGLPDWYSPDISGNGVPNIFSPSPYDSRIPPGFDYKQFLEDLDIDWYIFHDYRWRSGEVEQEMPSFLHPHPIYRDFADAFNETQGADLNWREWDFDGDGIPDYHDTNIDGDGSPNVMDPHPYNDSIGLPPGMTLPQLLTEITSCGLINTPGTYRITTDLTPSTPNCLVITADNVLVDGDGHMIYGSTGAGIYVIEAERAILRDVLIRQFGQGIYIDNADRAVLEGVITDDNTQGAVFEDSHNATIRVSTFTDNAMCGLLLNSSSHALVLENTISNNMRGICLAGLAEQNLFRNNIVQASSQWSIHDTTTAQLLNDMQYDHAYGMVQWIGAFRGNMNVQGNLVPGETITFAHNLVDLSTPSWNQGSFINGSLNVTMYQQPGHWFIPAAIPDLDAYDATPESDFNIRIDNAVCTGCHNYTLFKGETVHFNTTHAGMIRLGLQCEYYVHTCAFPWNPAIRHYCQVQDIAAQNCIGTPSFGNLLYDGRGHAIIGNNQGIGMYIEGQDDISIVNTNITNFATGMLLNSTTDVFLQNVLFEGNNVTVRLYNATRTLSHPVLSIR